LNADSDPATKIDADPDPKPWLHKKFLLEFFAVRRFYKLIHVRHTLASNSFLLQCSLRRIYEKRRSLIRVLVDLYSETSGVERFLTRKPQVKNVKLHYRADISGR
jgi:hypothetical protein